MFKTVRALTQEMLNYAGGFVLFGGSAMTGALFGWLTHATKILLPYAPLSWGLAGAAGALFFCSLLLLGAVIRRIFISATITRSYFESKPATINPLEDTFRKQRINISDFLTPFDRSIRNKTFIECEIVGPANVLLSATAPGKGQISYCDLMGCWGVLSKNDTEVPFGVLLQDCTILKCQLYGLTFFVPENGYHHIQSFMPGLPFVTPDPQNRVISPSA